MRDQSRSRQELLTLAIAALGSVGFVFLRLFVAAKGELSRFVVAGSRWTGPANHYLHHFLNSGYDGQFYWRLAADPFNIGLAPLFGTPLDHALRDNRIFYPVVSWALSLGQPRWVSAGLVVANVLAFLGLTYLAIRVCREVNRAPYWALLVLLVPGLIGSLSRDLTEIFSALLVAGGILALRKERYWLVALSWSLAGLTRETNILAAVCLGVVSFYELIGRKRSISWRDVAWVIPGVVFALWQVIAYQTLKSFPFVSSSGTGDLGWPLLGFFHGAAKWLPSTQLHVVAKAALYSIETSVTVILLVLAWRKRQQFNVVERLVIASFSLLFICETQRGWQVPFDNRYATVPLVLIWIGLLRGSQDRELRKYLWVAPLVLVTILWRVVVI